MSREARDKRIVQRTVKLPLFVFFFLSSVYFILSLFCFAHRFARRRPSPSIESS
jgi:hypothetical protein